MLLFPLVNAGQIVECQYFQLSKYLCRRNMLADILRHQQVDSLDEQSRAGFLSLLV